MTWFKIDDGFWSHPKTMPLSADAVALWTRAGAYSCQHLTDGYISKAVIRLVGDSSAATELVDAGLWIETGDGWSFHDWAEYQETAETVKRRQANARERQRRARAIREQKRHDSLIQSQGESQDASRVTDGVSSQEVFYPRPDPTRPDPTSKTSGNAGIAGDDEIPLPEPPPEDYDEPAEITAPSPPKSRATQAEMTRVRTIIGNDHPKPVVQQLALQVRKLGTYDHDVIDEALHRWANKTGIGPAVLPSLVSDIVKERKGGGRQQSKADMWEDHVVAPAQAVADTQQRELA